MSHSLKKIGASFLTIVYFCSIVSCSTVPKKIEDQISRQEIESKTLHEVSFRSINEKEIFKKIAQFEGILKKRALHLTKADWKLHDELLVAYVQLKNRPIRGSKIQVPARSRFKIDLASFCLNSNRASPANSEVFQWIKKDPGIPYYRELLLLTPTNEVRQDDVQELLWNLQNNTYWENYPAHLKAILQKIDPKVSIKLPSKTKVVIKDAAIDYIKNQIPLADKVESALSFVEGEYYNYDDFARSIREITSKYPLEKTNSLQSIPNTSIYFDIQSKGYSSQNIVF